jgi:hypothetical protein
VLPSSCLVHITPQVHGKQSCFAFRKSQVQISPRRLSVLTMALSTGKFCLITLDIPRIFSSSPFQFIMHNNPTIYSYMKCAVRNSSLNNRS